MCELLDVSTSGYYSWLGRPVSARMVADRALTDSIVEYWKRPRCSYGTPRIHADLANDGIRVGHKRVAWLMRTAGIQGITHRRRYRTAASDETSRQAPDLVQRRFKADAPNEIWVADITEIPTWEGVMYLAAVQDVWSRRIVGWALQSHMRTELVSEALNMAISQRSPTEVVHHSDQGTQYTSVAFGDAMPPQRGGALDRLRRRLLRQRHGQIVLRYRRMRTPSPNHPPNPTTSPQRDLQLDRRLVQPPPPALSSQLPITHRTRKKKLAHLEQQPTTIHKSGSTPCSDWRLGTGD